MGERLSKKQALQLAKKWQKENLDSTVEVTKDRISGYDVSMFKKSKSNFFKKETQIDY